MASTPATAPREVKTSKPTTATIERSGENSRIACVPYSGTPAQRQWLSSEEATAAANRLSELANKPYVRKIATLPDCHWKADMELPSSVAVNCGNHVVADVTSVAMNDCMTLILTDLRREQITREFLAAMFENVNRKSSAKRSGLTAYSPTSQELVAMLYEGAAAAVRKFQLPQSVLAAVEHRGKLNVDDISERELARLVPKVMLTNAGFRAEFGLNFGGNHYLEMQSVADVVDEDVARQWDIEPGRVTMMTHLGPGPFTGNLLHLYSRRTKVRRLRRVGYLAMKLPLHYTGRHSTSAAQRYRAYFSAERFKGYPLESEIGQDLYRVIRLGCNFGFAYQIGCYKAVIDGINETARQFGLPDPNARMHYSVSHNHIFPERFDGQDVLVGRHNSVRAYAGQPALLSGNYNVDSCLGIGLDGGDEYLRSYDHGVGALLARAEKAGELPNINGTSTGFKFKRGQANGLASSIDRPLRSREIVEQVMHALEDQHIVRPVGYLRPLGTLRN